MMPWALPSASTVASSTLYAGRNPPSGIFITRAWGSVVETRGAVTFSRLPLARVRCCRSLAAWASGRYASASAPRCPPSLAHPLYLLPGLLQAALQSLLAPKGGGPGTSPYPHPVLRYLVQTDHLARHQTAHNLGQQVIHRRWVRHSEVGEHMVVDGHATSQPAVGIMLMAEPVQLPSATHSLHRGIDPQRQEHLGLAGGTARPVQHRLDI